MRFISFFTDITQRKKVEAELKMHDKLLEGINRVLHGSLTLETEEEVAGKCLEVAEELTDSEFGFLGEISHEGHLNTLAISPIALEAFKISPEETELIKKMEIVSYWGRTIKEEKGQIVNNPKYDRDRRGFPGGHPPITSFLGVPLKQGNDTIGMIALANKERGYTEEDLENVESLSVAFVEALMRKRAEIRIKESHDILEERVEERTAELEEAYSSLKESEEKFRGIFDNATDMISLIAGSEKGRCTRYIEVNEAGIKRLGYSRDELLNMGPSDIDEEPETPKHIEKLLKTGHVQFETAHMAKDGRKIPVEVIIHIIEYNGRKAALEISRDISERKKAEEQINQYKERLEKLVKELKESKAHFKSLSENSPDLIIRVDNELKYLYANPVILEFTGKPPEYFTGKNIEEIDVPKEYISLWKDEYWKTFKTGKIQHMEFEFPTINGLKFFERITVPEFNDKGEIETALSISRDITGRKEVEKKLEETIGELKHSNEELQRFAYVASHDLQEPLRTISSFTQLLERRYRGKLDEDADEFIEYVVGAAQRMQQMIHDLLEYSRIMTKEKEFEEFNTENVLKEVINSLKIIIDENDALVTYDRLPTVIADESQIRRVFQNLIVNAIKFQKPDEPPMIHISARKDKKREEYVFSVSDNGIGIEEQYFDRIFTIFQRLHTMDKYQGTGIGLSIVERIIERHGGRIWVESEFGVGSTFYFTIPFNLH
jgi:PAS domain S-box-containing protein